MREKLDTVLADIASIYNNILEYFHGNEESIDTVRYCIEEITHNCIYVSHSELILDDELEDVIRNSREDAEAIYNNDPAATGVDEVILCYPGFKAILYYRIAHLFYEKGMKLLARGVSEKAHSMTGIDIHPGAVIGRRFAIDHGTGVVIGETTNIGNNVTIYQGVTLGAKHLNEREQVGQKRHPTIEDGVVIYANATILGGKTVIGKNSIIGANTFITYSIQENSKVM